MFSDIGKYILKHRKTPDLDLHPCPVLDKRPAVLVEDYRSRPPDVRRQGEQY